jgi:hypothetical protein
MKTNPILPCAGAALLALAACIVPPSLYERASFGPPPDYWQEEGRYRQAGSDPAAAARPAYPQSSAPMGPAPALLQDPSRAPLQPPLHAWDGGVVDGAPQGRVTAQEGTPRGLETPPAGRMHIIELYQQVLDERDALAEEVELLRKSLEETTLALDAKSKAADELSSRVAGLEAAQQALTSENQTLAERLVQAQIRRLEAEKLLLETRIGVERAKAEEAARAAAAQAKPGGAKPKASAKGEGGHE